MAYCNVEDFYEYTDLDEDKLSSNTVQRFIDRAYQKVNSITGTFYATSADNCTTITETLDPTVQTTDIGESYLILNKYPIQHLSTISINNSSYATSNFLVYIDRLKMSTTNSVISSFGTQDQSVTVVYKYGIIEPEQYETAKQLNIMFAVLDFVTTPKGRNIYLDNSRYAEINHNDVRPNDMVNEFIAQLRLRIEELKDSLGKAHKFF